MGNKLNMSKENSILPSFITPNYLNNKFNENNSKNKDDNNNPLLLTDTKIILDKKSLTIYKEDQIIYKSENFVQVIKKLPELKIPEEIDFDIELLKVLKNNLFIIIAKNFMRNGLYFIFKFNEAKKDVDIISEERDRSMIFIAQFDNGNFLYISFIHRPIFTQDTFYYFDIEKKVRYKIEEFGEYDDIYFSDIIILEDGIAFMNSFCANSEFKWEKLYITENINIKSYKINS